MDSMDESTVTSPSSGSSPLSLPRSPRPLRVLASGQLHMYMYNMSYDAVDYADALQPLWACVHVSCREDVLRCWPRVMYCRTTCIASSCQCKSWPSDERLATALDTGHRGLREHSGWSARVCTSYPIDRVLRFVYY